MALPRYDFKKLDLFAPDFAVAVIRYADAGQPLETDKHLPYVAGIVAFNPLHRGDVDAAAAVDAAVEIDVFFDDGTGLDLP
jgi:hypothetical protein